MSARDESHPTDRLSALLDGELSAEERASLEAHLGGCAGCRALLEGLRSVSRAVASEEPPPVPEGLAGRIAWRVRAEAEATGAPKKPWWRSSVPLAAAATLAAFGLLVGIWWLERGEPGIPDLPAAARRSAAKEQDRPVAALPPPVAKQVPSAAGESAPPPTPPALRERKREETASRRAAPKSAPPSAEQRYAAVAEERDKKVEAGDAQAVGGVVGGVLGGIVPSDEGLAERAAPAPASRDERLEERPPLAARPASVQPEAKLARAPGEQDARCPSYWAAPPPEGWILHGVDPVTAGEEIVRLATGLGGRAERVAAQPATWRLTVERGRFRELAAALRALGVSGADPELAVPAGTPCVEVRVTIAP